MATSMKFAAPVLRKRVRYLILLLSRLNFDTLFYKAENGMAVPFADIFPTGRYSVVGNSSVLLDEEKGTEIDSADYVIRFSDYKINGFEKNVGQKISRWITQLAKQLPDTNIPLIYLPTKYSSFKSKCDKIISLYGKNTISRFFIFHNDYILRAIRTALQCVPSVGLVTLLLLSVRYRNIHPYGFSFELHKGRYHYVNDRILPDITHDWTKEKDIFQFLLQSHLLSQPLPSMKPTSSRADYAQKPINGKIKASESSVLDDTNQKLKELVKLLKV